MIPVSGDPYARPHGKVIMKEDQQTAWYFWRV